MCRSRQDNEKVKSDLIVETKMHSEANKKYADKLNGTRPGSLHIA